MTPIRLREIARCRSSHFCDDCGREIPKGDFCLEIICTHSGQVVSIYTCCRHGHQVVTTPPRIAFKEQL